jgi:hypothetical protein
MVTATAVRSLVSQGTDIVLHGAVGDFLGGVAIGIAIAELVCRLLF